MAVGTLSVVSGLGRTSYKGTICATVVVGVQVVACVVPIAASVPAIVSTALNIVLLLAVATVFANRVSIAAQIQMLIIVAQMVENAVMRTAVTRISIVKTMSVYVIVVGVKYGRILYLMIVHLVMKVVLVIRSLKLDVMYAVMLEKDKVEDVVVFPRNGQ